MERALPPATLREKLPRFLQKCAQEFQDDARYRDDPRYLRVWIQLVRQTSRSPSSSLVVADFLCFVADRSRDDGG